MVRPRRRRHRRSPHLQPPRRRGERSSSPSRRSSSPPPFSSEGRSRHDDEPDLEPLSERDPDLGDDNVDDEEEEEGEELIGEGMEEFVASVSRHSGSRASAAQGLPRHPSPRCLRPRRACRRAGTRARALCGRSRRLCVPNRVNGLTAAAHARVPLNLVCQTGRRAAEREMRRRDLQRARGTREGRLPRVLGMVEGPRGHRQPRVSRHDRI